MTTEEIPRVEKEITGVPTLQLNARFTTFGDTYTKGITDNVDQDTVYTTLILIYRELKRRGEPVRLPWAK